LVVLSATDVRSTQRAPLPTRLRPPWRTSAAIRLKPTAVDAYRGVAAGLDDYFSACCGVGRYQDDATGATACRICPAAHYQARVVAPLSALRCSSRIPAVDGNARYGERSIAGL